MAESEARIVSSLAEVGREEWDALVGPEGSPFLEWDWLSGLEEAGCASAKAGWLPQHLTIRIGGRLAAAAPMFLKTHSQGEFVFDHAWADAAERAGIPYYPKLVVAVPFTPAGGRRLLTHPDFARPELLRVLARALRAICTGNEVSSIHVNFCEPDEVDALRKAGFLHRQGMQYQWFNRGYASFEEYLAGLRSKRRNQIRRERRDFAALGIEIETHEGPDIPDALFEPAYRIYLSTVDKYFWGRRYLNRAFFELLRKRFRRNLCLIVARRGPSILAGTVNVQKSGVFYGRYWGTFEEIRNLHFEVCYYAGIEHCIRRGLQRFEPGAGGEFKILRGFEPTPTHSMHLIAHPDLARAVSHFLNRERRWVDDAIAEMRARGR